MCMYMYTCIHVCISKHSKDFSGLNNNLLHQKHPHENTRKRCAMMAAVSNMRYLAIVSHGQPATLSGISGKSMCISPN